MTASRIRATSALALPRVDRRGDLCHDTQDSQAAESRRARVLTRIDHVGIACRDLTERIACYESAFGLTVVSREVNEAQGVREAMLLVADAPAGSSYVQLLEPLGPDTPVGRFIARRGEGLHHIGYGVADISEALTSLGAGGVRLIDERPRHGSMGASIAFVHPSDVGGVLTELVQAPAP
jgi:methylmalonyl-CoA/ethylmalonyl-CoA epimerase